MQPATQAWGFAAVRLLVTAVSGFGVGWLFGNPFGGLAAALALHLAWVLANLARLEWWLRHRSYADPPDIGGVWGEIIAQIVRLHRRKRFHKQRFVQADAPIAALQPRRCRTVWSSSTRSARSYGSIAWRRGC